MAKLLQMFPGVAVPASDAAKARVEESNRLRADIMSGAFSDEWYGPASQQLSIHSGELMPTPDEVAFDRGSYAIYDQMGRNVLQYRSAHDMRIDTVTGLPMIILPGKKGDKDSEQAAAEVRSQWENFDERMTALKCAGRFIERGFSALENIWDVQQRGASAGQFGIVAMIDRPIDWFGFDWNGVPYFKQRKYAQKNQPVTPYKVTWGRYGSLHSRYGRGIGQDDYPAVWTIDAVMKGHMEAVDRAGFIPVQVIYPEQWQQGRVDRLWREMKARWGNVFLVPGEVDSPTVRELTGGAYANANATGASRVEIMKTLESWIWMHVQGSQYSSNSGMGAYSKDKVVDVARMYKAPGDAACFEAMLNRGFARPIMLANRPTLDVSLWPRFAIDASFGEDLDQLLRVIEAGVKMGVKIETVTFCDRFKIKPADLEVNPEAELLTSPAPTPQIVAAAEPPVDPESRNEADPAARVSRKFGEHGGLIDVELHDGAGHVYFDPGQPVYTHNRGLVARAVLLQKGDRPLIPEAMVRAS